MLSLNSLVLKKKQDQCIIKGEDIQKNVLRDKLVRQYQKEKLWKKKAERQELIESYRKKKEEEARKSASRGFMINRMKEEVNEKLRNTQME